MSVTPRTSPHAWRISIFVLAAVTAWIQLGMERYRMTGPPLLDSRSLPFEKWRGFGTDSGTVAVTGRTARIETQTCTNDDCQATIEAQIPTPTSPYVVVTASIASPHHQGSSRVIVYPYTDGEARWTLPHTLIERYEAFRRTEYRVGFRVDPKADSYSISAQTRGPQTRLDVFDVRVEPAETLTTWRYLSRTLAVSWCAVSAFFVWRLLGQARRLPWPVVAGTAALLLGLMLPMGKHPRWQDDLAHVVLFAALSFAVSRSRPALGRLLLAVDLVLFSATTELLQSFTPVRAASVGDLAWDALGVGLGLSLARVWPRRAGSPAEA